MSAKEKERWFVAVKVFLRDGDKLLILKDIFDDGRDLPGGRIKRMNLKHRFSVS
jgi:predicted RNA-binding protein